MDIDHIKLQYSRLERHYNGALENRDPISFLDLSHVLRVWVEMKSAIDDLLRRKNLSFQLKSRNLSKEAKKILRGTKYKYLSIGEGVMTPGGETHYTMEISRALNADEVKKLYESSSREQKTTFLSFSQWLGSGIYDVPSGDENHPEITISREILIKRVANILGASHPKGADNSNINENRFDPYINDLHTLHVSDGYPATYYQLLKNAKDILVNIKI